MKRDMELVRKILFHIEDDYVAGAEKIWDLKIDGYDMPIIAEHCDLLHQQGFIKSYKPSYARGQNPPIVRFEVGNITASGYDYLELIRSDDVWNKTKVEMEKKQLPQTFEAIAKIAGIFVGNVIDQLKG